MFVACLILMQAMMHSLGAVNETRHSGKKLVESRAYDLPEDLINRTNSAEIWLCTGLMQISHKRLGE